MGFLLHDHRPLQGLVAVGDIPDFELDEVAAAQFAVDREIEQREVARAPFELQLCADRPDLAYS